ncbi:MAG TPA: hypothetical protein VF798_01770 [Burkholderiaceae bacterium]
MNTTRFIEATTLVSIGALCAAAVLTLTVPAKHEAAHEVAQATHTETVTIVAKRMTAAEKNQILKSGRVTI